MCIDIKNFYLTVALDYVEYMKIPLALFPEWIKKHQSQRTIPLPQDDTRKLINKEIKQVHKIVGSILYYVQAVDMTVLMALSTIASEQT
jgi:hypothetical protein